MFDLLQVQLRVQLPPVNMGYVLQHQTSCAHVLASNHIQQFGDVGVDELLHKMHLSANLVRLDRQQHLQYHFLLAIGVLPFKHVRVSPSAHLVTDGVSFQLSA